MPPANDHPTVPGNEIVNHPSETGMWQPIEAAPKGQMVRMKLSNGVECNGEYWPPITHPTTGKVIAAGGWVYDATSALLYQGKNPDVFDFDPTHWMPLPAHRIAEQTNQPDSPRPLGHQPKE